MPVIWMPPTLPPSIPAQASTQKPSPSDFGEELQVTGKTQEIDPVRQIVVYTDGVAARFGPTIVLSDRLEIHHAEGEKYAIATGNVRLDDPEGSLKAHSLTLWYGPTKGPDGQIAVADRVQIEIAGVTASAESAVIKPDRWEFLNVEGTSCKRPVPLYTLRSKKVVILPGREARVERPRIRVLGLDLGSTPTRRFSLDRRDPGLQLPSVGFEPGAGFGVSWKSGLLLDDSSIVLGDFSTFPKRYPSYSATYARTFLPVEVSNAQIVARSELVERFNWSYFDNIQVGTPTSSRGFTHKLRNAVTAQTIWNTSSSARLDRERFSKAVDLVYERSGPVGGFGTNLQVRAQSIRRVGEEFVERALVAGTISAPPLQLARGLSTDVRADLFGIAGERNAFGWIRTQAGIVYEPIPQFRLGAAFISAGETGTPDFVADRLVSRHAFHARADLNLGPTKISYLAKYDYDRKSWYDKEYSISQVVGCLEPFLVRREFPRQYALGVRFRFDDFFSLLERRKQVRTKPTKPQTISGQPER